MRLLRRLKLEELEQRVVPVTLLAGVPGSNHFTFTDADGDLVLVRIGNLLDPADSTSGSVILLNSDLNDPGTPGNENIATIVFDGATGGKTDFDIEIVGGDGNGSVDVPSITAPALLRQIGITGEVGTADLQGFDAAAIDATHFAGFITRGITGDVDHLNIVGGDLGVASNTDAANPEVILDIAGKLGNLTVTGAIGDGHGGVQISALDSIGDINASGVTFGCTITTPGNLHGMTLSGDFAGATLDAGSLGDSSTGSGGIHARNIIGGIEQDTDISGIISLTAFNTAININGNCYADINAVEKIGSHQVFIADSDPTDPGDQPITAAYASAVIHVAGNVGLLATISSGGQFANFSPGTTTVDPANVPLIIDGDLDGRVVSSLHGNTTFSPEVFAFKLGADTPTFTLRGHSGTNVDIVVGGDMFNAASIKVHGSALEFKAENVDLFSFSDSQQIRDLTFRDIVGDVTINHGVPSNGSLTFRDITMNNSLTIEGGIDGTLDAENVLGFLEIHGDSSGHITFTSDVVFLSFASDLAGTDVDHLMTLDIGGATGIISVDGNVGEFVNITTAGEVALIEVTGSFAASYFNENTDTTDFTLAPGGNIKFVKIDGPISNEIAVVLKDVTGITTTVDASHFISSSAFDSTDPGKLEIIDDSGNSQFLRISNGTALVTLLPVAAGSIITRVEVLTKTPSFELYGAEVGDIVGNKSLGDILIDPALFMADTTGLNTLTQVDLGTTNDGTVYTIESLTGGIGNIYSAKGDIVKVVAHKDVGNIFGGVMTTVTAKFNGHKLAAKPDFDPAANIGPDGDVGLLETAIGASAPGPGPGPGPAPAATGTDIIMDGFTGVYVDGKVGNTFASGDVANYRIGKDAGRINSVITVGDVIGKPIPVGTDLTVVLGGSSLIGFFEISGNAKGFAANTGIDVFFIDVGKASGSIVARGGDINAADGITVSRSIDSVEAGVLDAQKHFVGKGDIVADVTSLSGDIKTIRATNVLSDISAGKTISNVSADVNIGRRITTGVYEGSISAGKLGTVSAKNDIFSNIISDSSATSIIANADNDVHGGIYGDMSIDKSIKTISAFEDIAGDIFVGGNLDKLVTGSGSVTGDITVEGQLKLWEMDRSPALSPSQISGIVDIGKLDSLLALNTIVTGDITVGSLKTVFDTQESGPPFIIVISDVPPFQLQFTHPHPPYASGTPDGFLTIETGPANTLLKVK